MAKKRKKKKGSSKQKSLPVKPATEATDLPQRKDISQLDSPSFRVFSGIIALIFLANLLVTNGLTTVWSGAEAYNLWWAMGEESAPNALAWWSRLLYDDGPLALFSLRLSGPILLIAALGIGWWLGRRLFGKITIWLALLLLAASLLLPNLAKRATLDSWVFAAQLTFGLSTLTLLKQTRLSVQVAWVAGLVVALILEPLGSLLFAIPLILFLWRSHPEGRQLLNIRLWGIVLLLVLGIGLLWGLPWLDRGISFGWLRSGYGRYLGWQVVATLPFIGFVLGGLRDLFFKLRRGEEFAVLVSGWLLAALLSQSPTLSWVLALLAAKQMQLYFHPRYPFHAWVRGGALLQLILAFGAFFLAMVYGFWEFGAVGFRTALLVSSVYWGFCLAGAIGLYGFQHRLLIGGPILAGVGLTFMFWIWFYPLLESKRQWPLQLVEIAERQQNTTTTLPLIMPETVHDRSFPAVAVYARDRFDDVRLPATRADQQAAWVSTPGIYLLDSLDVMALSIPTSADTVSGWDDRGRRIWYQSAIPKPTN